MFAQCNPVDMATSFVVKNNGTIPVMVRKMRRTSDFITKTLSKIFDRRCVPSGNRCGAVRFLQR